MATYLITGSSRGLGLALATHLASLPTSEVGTIFATARSDNSAELQALVKRSSGRVEFVKLDATKQSDIDSAAKHVQDRLGPDKGLDVLINNAGIMTFSPDGVETMNDLNSVLDINVTSAHRVTVAFLPLLRKGEQKKVFNITSTLGSMAMAHLYPFPSPAYKISKAALNMLTVQYALDLGKEGFIFVAMSPGWLKTDLGTEQADLPVEVGAEAVVKTILNASKDDNGKSKNIHVAGWEDAPGPNQYDGKNPPW